MGKETTKKQQPHWRKDTEGVSKTENLNKEQCKNQEMNLKFKWRTLCIKSFILYLGPKHGQYCCSSYKLDCIIMWISQHTVLTIEHWIKISFLKQCLDVITASLDSQVLEIKVSVLFHVSEELYSSYGSIFVTETIRIMRTP